MNPECRRKKVKVNLSPTFLTVSSILCLAFGVLNILCYFVLYNSSEAFYHPFSFLYLVPGIAIAVLGAVALGIKGKYPLAALILNLVGALVYGLPFFPFYVYLSELYLHPTVYLEYGMLYVTLCWIVIVSLLVSFVCFIVGLCQVALGAKKVKLPLALASCFMILGILTHAIISSIALENWMLALFLIIGSSFPIVLLIISFLLSVEVEEVEVCPPPLPKEEMPFERLESLKVLNQMEKLGLASKEEVTKAKDDLLSQITSPTANKMLRDALNEYMSALKGKNLELHKAYVALTEKKEEALGKGEDASNLDEAMAKLQEEAAANSKKIADICKRLG